MRDVSAWLVRHPKAADSGFALVLAPWVIGATMSLNRGAVDWPYVIWGLAYLIPMVWRRTRPNVAAALLTVPHLIQLVVTEDPSIANITVPVILYAVAANARSRWSWIWLGIAEIAAAAAAWRWSVITVEAGAMAQSGRWFVAGVNWAMITAICVAAWVLGLLARERRLSILAVHERAAALEREREQTVELAASRERASIAREMHDIVAHSLSLIVVQCDGARYVVGTDGDPQHKLATAKSALDTIGETARTALTDTRRLVGVLKDGTAPQRTPAAALADIPELIERVRTSGVPIELVEHGVPTDHPPLGATAEMTAYRILQEALTNVLKHAGEGASARVTIAHQPTGLRLEVLDDGQGPIDDDGMGHGILGMRERAAACGGSLIARPRLGSGFEVIATIPVRQET